MQNRSLKSKAEKKTHKPNCIFNDANGNETVDAQDFGNNEALVSIVIRAGWLNKK